VYCSWNEHLAIDVPSAGGVARDCALAVELWLQPTGQADEPSTEQSPGVFLGRAEIRVHQLLENRGTVPSQEGWFKLSGDAGSVHVLLRFIAADSSRAEQFFPVNAVMLRLKCDRLLSRRAWRGWTSHHRTRKQLQGLVIDFQRFSQAAARCVQKVFGQWQSNVSALFESRAKALLQTQDVEEEEEQASLHLRSNSSARRRKSSGYGHGYGSLAAQQKLQSTRVSLEREERAEEQRTRRW
jgi:hypothetical protein